MPAGREHSQESPQVLEVFKEHVRVGLWRSVRHGAPAWPGPAAGRGSLPQGRCPGAPCGRKPCWVPLDSSPWWLSRRCDLVLGSDLLFRKELEEAQGGLGAASAGPSLDWRGRGWVCGASGRRPGPAGRAACAHLPVGGCWPGLSGSPGLLWDCWLSRAPPLR